MIGFPNSVQSLSSSCHRILRSLSSKLEEAQLQNRLEELVQTQDTSGIRSRIFVSECLTVYRALEHCVFSKIVDVSQTLREFVIKTSRRMNFLKTGLFRGFTGHTQNSIQKFSNSRFYLTSDVFRGVVNATEILNAKVS